MKTVCDYFEEIMGVPRESGKEEKIAQFLVNYAKENNIECHVGECNTVFLRKNNNSDKTIILQAHSDMVCVSTTDFDFDNEGIPFYIDGDYYKSKCTSLGADDGIGVAIILAMMQESENMPNIEAIITTQEETTMLGANVFDYSLVTGKTLVSLDGAKEGDIEAASASMRSIRIIKNINFAEDQNNAYKLSIKGLKGGHSGEDINKGRCNAIKLATMILNTLGVEKISEISFGKRDNVIPSDGFVTFSSELDLDTLKSKIESIDFKLSEEDSNFEYALEPIEKKDCIAESGDIINILTELKCNLLATYEDGFPLLSANIGAIHNDENSVTIVYSIRSSNQTKEDELIAETEALAHKYNFEFKIDSPNPFLEFKEKSQIRELLIGSYKDLYNKEAFVKKIHAGVEGGIFAAHIEGLDVCTIAPTIEDFHSVDERVSISSTKRVYEWLKETLKRFNSVEG